MNTTSGTAVARTASSAAGGARLSALWFYGFFFVSGFCSLIYEVVWLRLAVARFGVTTPLVSILLSVFMAGLGLGSWWGGRLAERHLLATTRTLLRSYAALEFTIGLSSIAVPALLAAGSHLMASATGGIQWGSGLFYLVSGLIITAALLPWCTAMGATLPFAMAAIRAANANGTERTFSMLYLANVVGALAGTLIPAFILIELFGFRGTLAVGGTLNFLLAAVVFFLSSSYRLGNAFRSPDLYAHDEPTPTSRPTSLLVQLFLTGLCSMALEVIWIRQFNVYLGNVVYAFSIILALYLSATVAGSRWYRRDAARGRASLRLPWLLLGLSAMLPLLFADPRVPIPESLSVLRSLGLGTIRAALAIVPFSALVGYITPMLVDTWSGGSPRVAGRAYAVNVLGSIVGPLIAGFLVVPLVGEHWGLLLLALPLFAVGWTFSQTRSAHRILYLAAVAAAALLLAFTSDYGVKIPGHLELRDHTATVLASGTGMRKRLLVNGTGMTKMTPITKMMAHLPLAFLDHPARKGLVICMGMGTSFRSMASWGIDTTVVELVPSVPRFFAFFHPDAPQLLSTGRAHIVVDDGRRFLERSREQFDVMAIDPPPPIGAPTSSLLYSLEFYRTVKAHMAPDGVFQIWSPGGDPTTNAAIAKSIVASFPYVRVFGSIENWGTHFLVSQRPIVGDDADELAARVPPAARADMTEFSPAWKPADLIDDALAREADPRTITRLDFAAPPITDDRAVNEYFLLRIALPGLY